MKDKIIVTALNAIIKDNVTTKVYDDKYIIRVNLNSMKDFVKSITLQEFRAQKTHILVDNIMKSFRHYIYSYHIDAKNWKTVFNYLSNKEYLKSEE